MMSSLRLRSESFFTVATTVPITRASCISFLGCHDIHGINYSHDRGVDWRVFHVLRQTSARPGDNQHALVKAGADSIDRDDVAARARAIQYDGPNDKQLFPFQSFVLL